MQIHINECIHIIFILSSHVNHVPLHPCISILMYVCLLLSVCARHILKHAHIHTVTHVIIGEENMNISICMQVWR